MRTVLAVEYVEEKGLSVIRAGYVITVALGHDPDDKGRYSVRGNHMSGSSTRNSSYLSLSLQVLENQA